VTFKVNLSIVKIAAEFAGLAQKYAKLTITPLPLRHL
jgi:hypothetical protein